MKIGDRVVIENEMIFGIVKNISGNFIEIKTQEGFSTIKHISEVSIY